MRTARIARLLVPLALAGLLPTAWTAEQVVPVSATIASDCRWRSPLPALDLGPLDPLGTSPMAGGALAVELLCRTGDRPRLFLDGQPIPLDAGPVPIQPAAPLRHETGGDTLPFDVVAYTATRSAVTGGRVLISVTLNIRTPRDALLDAPAGRYRHSLTLRFEP